MTAMQRLATTFQLLQVVATIGLLGCCVAPSAFAFMIVQLAPQGRLPLDGITEQHAATSQRPFIVSQPLYAQSPKATLLEKLGGEDAVTAAVDIFYSKLLDDSFTAPFFDDIPMNQLRGHQIEFMKLAFTEVPPDLDVPAYMIEKHQRLFPKGLNGQHFDRVAEHFVGSLTDLDVPQTLIDEAVGVIAPLRPAFEKGYQLAHPDEEK